MNEQLLQAMSGRHGIFVNDGPGDWSEVKCVGVKDGMLLVQDEDGWVHEIKPENFIPANAKNFRELSADAIVLLREIHQKNAGLIDDLRDMTNLSRGILNVMSRLADGVQEEVEKLVEDHDVRLAVYDHLNNAAAELMELNRRLIEKTTAPK